MTGPTPTDPTAPDPTTAMLAALTGSATPGQYPDTLHDRLDIALAAAWTASTGLNLPVPSSGGAPGPFRAAGALADDPAAIVLDQACARFGTAPKARTITEKAALLAALVAGIETAGSPPSIPGGPGGLPPGTTPGVATWAADLHQAGVVAAGFKSTPWNTQHGPSWPPPIVAAPAGDTSAAPGDGLAIRFSLGAGGQRIEVEPDCPTFGPGQDPWIGLWFYLAPGFPLAVDDWQVITQFHGNDTTSPQQAIQVRSGQLSVADAHPFGPLLVTGRWYALVVRFSTDPHGTTSAWLDDQPVLAGYPAGLNNTPLYWKTGLYHSTAIPAATLYQAGHAVGTGYGAVRPS